MHLTELVCCLQNLANLVLCIYLYVEVHLKLLDRKIDDSLSTDVKGLIEEIHGVKLYIRKASNAIIEVLHSLPNDVQESLPDDQVKELDQLVKEQARELQPKPKQVSEPKSKVKKGKAEQPKKVESKKAESKKVSKGPSGESKIVTKKGREIS